MAFDEYFAERIGTALTQKGVAFETKKMFGGLCFMVRGNMLCGPMFNKKLNQEVLMVRVGQENEALLENEKGALPMDFTGRRMKGYLFVEAAALDDAKSLEKWLDRCLTFNQTLPIK